MVFQYSRHKDTNKRAQCQIYLSIAERKYRKYLRAQLKDTNKHAHCKINFAVRVVFVRVFFFVDGAGAARAVFLSKSSGNRPCRHDTVDGRRYYSSGISGAFAAGVEAGEADMGEALAVARYTHGR